MNGQSNPEPPKDIQTLFDRVIGHRVGLCVSGGPDSLVMLHAAAQWLKAADKESRTQFVVLTVDHGLRPEAAEEAAFVADQAKTLGFPHRTLSWEHEASQSRKVSQEAARTARHGLLRSAAQELSLDALCFAHTQDDFAETFLMRLSHGSGLRGLAGSRPDLVSGTDLQIFRPLSHWSRNDILTYVASQNLVPVNDPSNQNEDFQRVRTRQAIAQGQMPAELTTAAINRTINRLNRADDALDQIAGQFLTAQAQLNPLGFARFPRKIMMEQPEEVRIRAVGALLGWVAAGNSPTHDHALSQQIEVVSDALEQNDMPDQTLRGCLIRTTDTEILITREPYRQPPQPLTLAPNQKGVFDHRFEVTSLSADVQIVPMQVEQAYQLRREDTKLKSVPIEAVMALPVEQFSDREAETLVRPVLPVEFPVTFASKRAKSTFLGKIHAPLR